MSSPKISPKPLPRITPNTNYAEDGFPITRFEANVFDDPPTSIAKALELNATVSVKPLHNGWIAIGDVS